MTVEDSLRLFKIDCRTFRLLDPKFIEVFGDDKKIIKLQRPNDVLEINVGSVVKNGKDPLRVNIILRGVVDGRVHCYDLKTCTFNGSSIFIVPMLGFQNKNNMFWDNLVNTFMCTQDYEEVIALLYRFDASVEFGKYETLMFNHPNFIMHYEQDKYHTLYVFSVPDHVLTSYRMVKAGKYSEVDSLVKLIILDFHNFSHSGHTGQILYKDPELRQRLEESLGIDLGEAELHSIPDMKIETYDPDYYRIITALK